MTFFSKTGDMYLIFLATVVKKERKKSKCMNLTIVSVTFEL